MWCNVLYIHVDWPPAVLEYYSVLCTVQVVLPLAVLDYYSVLFTVQVDRPSSCTRVLQCSVFCKVVLPPAVLEYFSVLVLFMFYCLQMY